MEGRCATCKHWQYADLYTPEWETLPRTHLWSYGDCKRLNDESRDLREVECAWCEVNRRGRDVRDELEARHEHTYPTIETHWTFGCVLWEPS